MKTVRLIIAVVLLSSIFLWSLFSRFEDLLFNDRLDQMETQIKNQVSTMNSAFATDSKFLLKWVQSLSEEGVKKINWNSLSPYFAVAQLNSSLQIIEWSFREKSPISNMSKENLTQLISSFKISSSNKEIIVRMYVNSERQRIFLTLIPFREKLWVFSSMGENLQSLMDTQKTSPYPVSILNSDLYNLAHLKLEYIGQKNIENSILAEIKKNQKQNYGGLFKSSMGEEFFAYFEKVNDMDLYVYTQISMTEQNSYRSGLKKQFLMLTVGFLFLLTGCILFLSKSQSADMAASKINTSPKTEANNAVTTIVTDGSATNSSTDSATESVSDAMESYMKIASAFSLEMKGPLIKILTWCQTYLAQENINLATETIKRILQESRIAKETIDKLLLFSGEKKEEPLKMKLETPLLRAIKNMEAQFQQKSVKIFKDFSSERSININVNPLIAAFENIFKNSVQAMDRQLEKEIRVSTYEKDEHIFVEIVDNGEGISPEALTKVFDPFFTTRSYTQNLGLGLTVSLGILKEHEAEIKIDSKLGKGTKILIDFDIQKNLSESLQMDEQLIFNEQLKLDKQLKSDEGQKLDEQAKINLPKSKDEKSQTTVETKSTMSSDIKPIVSVNLNVSVDDLFNVSEIEDDNEDLKKSEPKMAKTDKTLANAEISSEINSEINSEMKDKNKESDQKNKKIVSPKNLPKLPNKLKSDDFEVQIRKPSGGNS